MKRFPRYIWLLCAVACLACGLTLLFNPDAMARSVCRIIGVIALIGGLSELADGASAYSARNRGSGAILSVIIAIVLIFMPDFVLRSISLIAGVIIAAACLHSLMSSLEARVLGRRYWFVACAVSALGTLLGVIMLFGGISATNIVVRMIGLVLASGGAGMLVSALTGRY